MAIEKYDKGEYNYVYLNRGRVPKTEALMRKLKNDRAKHEKRMGRRQKMYEHEANPEMHAFKNSMRRKGFGAGSIFHHALGQAERYRKEHNKE